MSGSPNCLTVETSYAKIKLNEHGPCGNSVTNGFSRLFCLEMGIPRLHVSISGCNMFADLFQNCRSSRQAEFSNDFHVFIHSRFLFSPQIFVLMDVFVNWRLSRFWRRKNVNEHPAPEPSDRWVPEKKEYINTYMCLQFSEFPLF